MPRTKATNRGKPTAASMVANKRSRDSVTEEMMLQAIRDLDCLVEESMFNNTLDYEQGSEQLNNLFENVRTQLGLQVLAMTLDELENGALSAINATTVSGCHNSTTMAGSRSVCQTKRTPRDDEGYLTDRSSHRSSTMSSGSSVLAAVPASASRPKAAGGRLIGPLASAKAKGRRSRSAQNMDTTAGVGAANVSSAPNASSTMLQRSNSQTGGGHQSRSKFRTPAMNRLQTMSAERQMAPVTPKMQPDRPLSMLRYQKMGETVISLSGSPVIAQGVTRDGANINIPVANGIISVLPSAMSSVEPSFMSQLDPETLQQLRMLQKNLNLMMSTVKD